MTILITGAAGLLGRRVAHVLLDGSGAGVPPPRPRMGSLADREFAIVRQFMDEVAA